MLFQKHTKPVFLLHSSWAFDHWAINYLLHSKFIQAIQAFHTYSNITSKDDIPVIVLYLNIALLSSYFTFIQFRRDIFKSFFSWQLDKALLIYVFVTFNSVTKICLLKLLYVEYMIHLFVLSFKPQKFIIIIIWINQHITLLGFLNQCLYTLQNIPNDYNFYLICLQTQYLALLLHCNPYHIELFHYENSLLHPFSLPCIYWPFLFIGSFVSFSDNCGSTSFQKLG